MEMYLFFTIICLVMQNTRGKAHSLFENCYSEDDINVRACVATDDKILYLVFD